MAFSRRVGKARQLLAWSEKRELASREPAFGELSEAMSYDYGDYASHAVTLFPELATHSMLAKRKANP